MSASCGICECGYVIVVAENGAICPECGRQATPELLYTSRATRRTAVAIRRLSSFWSSFSLVLLVGAAIHLVQIVDVVRHLTWADRIERVGWPVTWFVHYYDLDSFHSVWIQTDPVRLLECMGIWLLAALAISLASIPARRRVGMWINAKCRLSSRSQSGKDAS
ncbi:MAG: hypothetical protein RBS39_10555 [Phycisphaerales bacterium]|nr:hypothetical protein [Phycisphaerales bacterium]